MRDACRPTRRALLRAAATAAAACLPACVSSTRRGDDAAPGGPVAARRGELDVEALASRATFLRICDAGFAASTADHLTLRLRDALRAATRFESPDVELPIERRRELWATVAFGARCARVCTIDLSEDAVVAAVRGAEEMARRTSPVDGCPAPLPPQVPRVLPLVRRETTAAGSAERSRAARAARALCQEAGFEARGTLATQVESVGVAGSGGLLAFERRGEARFELRVRGEQGEVRTANAHRSFDDLGLLERARDAVARLRVAAVERRPPAGDVTLVLGHDAAGQLVAHLIAALDARPMRDLDHPLFGRLGKRVIDERFTLRNRPDHPDLLGAGFDADGLSADRLAWIERGVLKRVYRDRADAPDDPVYALDAPQLVAAAFEDPHAPAHERPASLEAIVSRTRRGLLIAGLADLRSDERGGLSLVGAADGPALIVEDGEIVGAVRALPWRDNVLRVLNDVQAFTTPREAIADGGLKLLAPALAVSGVVRT